MTAFSKLTVSGLNYRFLPAGYRRVWGLRRFLVHLVQAVLRHLTNAQ